MCGGPVPQEAFLKNAAKANGVNRDTLIIGGLAGLAAVIVLIVVIIVLSSNSALATVPTPQATQPTQPPPEYNLSYDYVEITRQAPYLHITDPGLRQSLELLLGMEIRHIGWESLEQIKAITVARETVIFGMESVNTIEEINNAGITVLPDVDVRDLSQLRYFDNLKAVAIRIGEPTGDVLAGLPNVEVLEVVAGRTIADFAPFVVLPELQRLTVTGRNFASLQGISELTGLSFIELNSTGITDLSVLSQQRHITELRLIDNRELGSFGTLQDMTWLSSLHIERSGDRDLNFISNLTGLESLTIIRSETRTYSFILPLINLRYLRLFENRDVPEIPSLAGFTQLEELHLDTGRNTGTVRPTDYLEGLTSVRRMTLHNPDSIEGLRGMQLLEELDISFGWLLTDASALGSLTNLRRLRIYDSRTFESEVRGMNAIGQLAELRVLNISDNDLYFNWDFIYGLQNLEILNISDNNVIGNFGGIGRLQNLRVLHMNNIRIMESYRISRSGGMVSIYFVGTADVDDFSHALSNLTNLEILSIRNNGVTSIDFVAGMRNLQRFDAEDNFISDVSPLTELPNLSFVNLRRNAVNNWSELDEMINTTVLGR